MTAATLVAILAVCTVAIWFEILCLKDLARAEDEELRYLTRWQSAIVCVMTIPLGGIIYLTYGRGPQRFG